MTVSRIANALINRSRRTLCDGMQYIKNRWGIYQKMNKEEEEEKGSKQGATMSE